MSKTRTEGPPIQVSIRADLMEAARAVNPNIDFGPLLGFMAKVNIKTNDVTGEKYPTITLDSGIGGSVSDGARASMWIKSVKHLSTEASERAAKRSGESQSFQ
jgi:hypothetical protein